MRRVLGRMGHIWSLLRFGRRAGESFCSGVETGEVPQTGMGQSLKEGTALLLGKDRKYKPLAIYMQQQRTV